MMIDYRWNSRLSNLKAPPSSGLKSFAKIASGSPNKGIIFAGLKNLFFNPLTLSKGVFE